MLFENKKKYSNLESVDKSLKKNKDKKRTK